METQLYSVKVGKFEDHSRNLEHIFAEHWDEVAQNKHVMVLKPDYNSYQLAEEAGKLFVLYAYYGDEVVGYSYNFLTNHLHYADTCMAHNDLLFVAKAHRNSPIGLKLIRETEKIAKSLGAQMMMWRAKKDTTLGSILPRMGCRVQEIVYSKEL